MRAARAPAIGLLAALAACAPDFAKRSEIFDLRILAILADKLEAGPGEQVSLRGVTAAPAGVQVVEEEWRFCPFSLGSTVGYACASANPRCDRQLKLVQGQAVDGAVTADPGADALDCLAALAGGGAVPPPGTAPSGLPDPLPALYRYAARGSDGVSREAVLRFPLYADPPWLKPGSTFLRNLPPAFADPAQPLRIGGSPPGAATALARGTEVEICAPLDPASAQAYTGAAGEVLTETLVVSFYSTAGTFDYDRASSDSGFCAKLKLDVGGAVTQASLWAVGRDLRGGQVVAGPYAVALR